MSGSTPLRVAVLGAGTVGGSVVRAFLENADRLAPLDGAPLVLAGIAEKAIDRAIARGFPAHLLTDAPAHLVASPDIDVVVELLGGDEPARTLVAAALQAGKPVVTANKHVIAHHGLELEAIARRSGAALRFEAAVGGGIPILGPLGADLALNRFRRVRGIVNGTTNFILTAMRDAGRPYDEVLAEAQANGYAEADPRGDVEGDDAVNKIVILARLAFGSWVEPAAVTRTPPTLRGAGRPGITGITADELGAAAALGLGLKLLAAAEPTAGGGVSLSVLPTALPAGSPLARTDGVLNRVELCGDPVGEIAFSGPGAGGAATSSAIVGDLLAIARGAGSTWAGLPPASEAQPRAAARQIGEPMAWFVFLPGTVDAGAPDVAVEAARYRGGSALRTAPIPLARLREALVPLLPEGADAACYPVAE